MMAVDMAVVAAEGAAGGSRPACPTTEVATAKAVVEVDTAVAVEEEVASNGRGITGMGTADDRPALGEATTGMAGMHGMVGMAGV